MKTVIVGAGAMGGVFGGLLHEAGEDVCFLDVWADHVNAIRQNGLWLEGVSGERFIPVKAFTQPSDIDGPADIFIIFVKSNHTKNAARAIAPFLKKDSVVLTLQNGLGNQQALEEVLGKGKVLIGTTSAAGLFLGPGRIRHTGWGDIHIGEPDGSVLPRTEAVAKVLAKTGFETDTSDNAQGIVWTKLLVNACLNAPALVMRVRNGEIQRTEECRAFALEVLDECMKIVKAKGIKLVYPDMKEGFLSICEKTGPNINSMYQDFLAKRPTEIDFMNGALVHEGESLGIPMPLNRALTLLVKGLEATQEVRVE